MFYFTRVGPCGVATGLDIGLGNMSLQFITLTFYSRKFHFPALPC
jgi:solute carrier family 35, member C2